MSNPDYANVADFAKAARIPQATITSTEDGLNRAGLDNIEKWVTACGVTLVEFFSQFEEKPGPAVVARMDVQITVKRKNKDLHEQLEKLLVENGPPADWISGNVTVFHRDYETRAKAMRSKPKDLAKSG